MLVTVLGIVTDVSDESTKASAILVTPVAITTAPVQLLLCVTEPETILYLPDKLVLPT
jgi:hypothetical protein